LSKKYKKGGLDQYGNERFVSYFATIRKSVELKGLRSSVGYIRGIIMSDRQHTELSRFSVCRKSICIAASSALYWGLVKELI